MLLIVPSSEGKRSAPAGAPPLDLASLSFPALRATRERAIDALVETSAAPGALARLGVGASLVPEVVRNRTLRAQPAAPALEVYTGVVHAALGASTLSPAARVRADASVVLASALFGLLRPSDRIPAYRLPVSARLAGVRSLATLWHPVLGAAIAEAAGESGAILDLRAASYQALGVPAGMGSRAVILRLAKGTPGGTVVLKQLRGAVARHLLEQGSDPRTPAELADLLRDAFRVGRLIAPVSGGCYALELAPRS